MIGKKIALGALLAAVSLTALYTLNIAPAVEPESVSALDMTCGFSDDFASFLKKNYAQWDFARGDLKCASFGGKASSSEKLSKTPVIFVHGNSDIGFGRGSEDGYVSWQTGFRSLATYLGTQGYKKAELYTTTWGPANPNAASQNNHAKKYILQMRAFVEAVLAYTKAKEINVIGHSMGVTIGRKIIQGGQAVDQKEGTYAVGDSLKSHVKNFIGLAGANLGLTACLGGNLIPTCSNIDGFNPGTLPTSGPSKLFAGMNANPASEGTNVYTIWSKNDDLIGSQCVVWGKVTSRIPGQKAEVVKSGFEWNHFAVRDKTGADLIGWLN